MAVSLETLLNIKAQVTGSDAVSGLAGKLGSLSAAGDNAGKGLKGLAGSAGGLVGGLKMLVPLASGAGLVAMGKSAIDTGDNMFDLSQKTGVSVERLSQLDQAAKMSGTTIESVGKAMVKLNRGLVDGKADEALNRIGISSKDAAGNLKTADAVMLEVANKFATMPDGAEKTSVALGLFGRAGADMIPMLNMGGDAIKKLSVTMTTDFAKGADQANDKMVALETKFSQLGIKLGTTLLPFLVATTDALVALASGFAAIPEPIQGVILAVGLLVIAWGPIAGFVATIQAIGIALSALQLGAVIAGWAGAIVPFVTQIGVLTAGLITVIQVAFTGLVTFLTGTILPAILAFFSGPVGWTVLAVAAVVAMVALFKEPIGKFLVWLGQGFTDAVTKLNTYLSAQWTALGTNFKNYVTTPITNGWNAAMQALPNAIKSAGTIINTIWTSIVSGFKSGFAGFINFVNSGLNAAKNAVNFLINAYNKLPASDIPLIGNITIPKFAAGGYVTGPTLGMVGEGGQPEYIIPENRMAAASARYLSGARGDALLAPGGGAGAGAAPVINITTGPVIEFDGKRYVTVADFERGLRQASSNVFRNLRTPAGRYAMGIK